MKTSAIISTVLIVIFFFIAGLASAEKTNAQLPINAPEKAIAYAKTIADVKTVMEKWRMKGWRVEFFAHFDDVEKIWIVVLAPKETRDLSFAIKLKEDGAVISKGYGEGG